MITVFGNLLFCFVLFVFIKWVYNTVLIQNFKQIGFKIILSQTG